VRPATGRAGAATALASALAAAGALAVTGPHAGLPPAPGAAALGRLEVPYPGSGECAVPGLGAIAASVYSLPSEIVAAEEASALLAAVRALAPRRLLLVFADGAQRERVGAAAPGLAVQWIDPEGRALTPWPRDPLTFLRCADGGLLVLARPNLQASREEDAAMAPLLAQGLPPSLAGSARWSVGPTPFHNGQILTTDEAIWISLHSQEPRILELLGLDRVPVDSFATDAGIDRYLAAAESAAAELGAAYGRHVRWVHPLPAAGPTALRRALMDRLGGGAGFDLDSLVTLLPGEAGVTAALVGDREEGARLLARLGPADWEGLAAGYALASSGGELAAALGAAQASPRAAALDGFLELVAAHLAGRGLRVARLPVLLVPTGLLPDRPDLAHQPDFIVGWNNVVPEVLAAERRAEGFASLLPTGDAAARAAYGAFGYRLDLLPPLVESVRRNGGYRCASNHVYGEGAVLP
jgi:hypothetical protein